MQSAVKTEFIYMFEKSGGLWGRDGSAHSLNRALLCVRAVSSVTSPCEG